MLDGLLILQACKCLLKSPTFNFDNIIEIYTAYISTYLKEFLYYGSELLNLRQNEEYSTEYMDNAEDENVLHSGIHIDLMDKSLHVWSSNFYIFDYKRLEAMWDGYKIFYHRDRFEMHTELTDGRLCFIERDRSDLINKVKQIVCRNQKDPFSTINALISRLSEQDKEVKVSPAASTRSKTI